MGMLTNAMDPIEVLGRTITKDDFLMVVLASFLALCLSLTLSASALPIPQVETADVALASSHRKLTAYESSIAACENGSDGVIILFKDHDARRQLSSTVAMHPGDTIDRQFHSMPAVTAHLSDPVITSYLHDPAVESVQANCVLKLDDGELNLPAQESAALGGSSLDQESAKSWGLDRIDSRSERDGLYKHGQAKGEKSRIYILDTGVRVSHADFEGRAVAGWSAGCPTGTEAGCANDWVHKGVITASRSTCHSHGTHCASTAAGGSYGVSKSSSIITVQVLSCHGYGSYSTIVAGIEWAVEDAANYPDHRSVISMSLGGHGVSEAVFRAVKLAHVHNVVVVAAAGNSNSNACQYSPAGAPEAITVGSTTSFDTRSSFSSHGSCVDIFAPGSSITAAWGTSDVATNTISGTSMATPHVAGAIAQLLTVQPTYSAQRATEVIKCMATPNVINGVLPPNTVNSLLYAGEAMSDDRLTTCGMSPSPSPAPSPPPSPSSPPPISSPPSPRLPSSEVVYDPPLERRSASSTHSPHGPGGRMCQDGRLDSPWGTGWCAGSATSKTEWYQLALGEPTLVSGVVTMGRGEYDQWVTQFEVTTSLDGVGWTSRGIFNGNTDQTSQLKSRFKSAVVAKYVRIHPMAWTGFNALRAGLLVGASPSPAPSPSPSPSPPPPISSPPSPRLPSSEVVYDPPLERRSASSTHSPHGPGGRMCQDGRLDSPWGTGWCAGSATSKTEWYQLALGEPTLVSGVVTMGRGEYDQWVTQFEVTTSLDGVGWTSRGIFNGNTDQTSQLKSRFKSAVVAKYVRIHPMAWTGFNALRAGLLVGASP